MKVPLWVLESAAVFWQEAGTIEPFPRELRGSISRALPLSVIYLSKISVAAVHEWLRRNRVACPGAIDDRPLRACLVARAGAGFVFLAGTDAENEQRFSLAHELAHFLRHYWHPRQLASRRLGPRILEVLDGQRPATFEERLQAVLRFVPVGFHIHLMERDERGRFADSAVAVAEHEADRLAYELLAPAEAVQSRLGTLDGTALADLLGQEFGLPRAQAEDYGDILMPRPPADPLLRRLGLSFENFVEHSFSGREPTGEVRE